MLGCILLVALATYAGSPMFNEPLPLQGEREAVLRAMAEVGLTEDHLACSGCGAAEVASIVTAMVLLERDGELDAALESADELRTARSHLAKLVWEVQSGGGSVEDLALARAANAAREAEHAANITSIRVLILEAAILGESVGEPHRASPSLVPAHAWANVSQSDRVLAFDAGAIVLNAGRTGDSVDPECQQRFDAFQQLEAVRNALANWQTNIAAVRIAMGQI